jgi:hypothetical protein
MLLDTSAFELLHGPLFESAGRLPIIVSASMCDLRPRFLEKGMAGRGYRAIARNGRVLVASWLPLADLPGRDAQVRVQTWHRVHLPGDVLRPFGLLVCLRPCASARAKPLYQAELMRSGFGEFVLELAVGGGMILALQPTLAPP